MRDGLARDCRLVLAGRTLTLMLNRQQQQMLDIKNNNTLTSLLLSKRHFSALRVRESQRHWTLQHFPKILQLKDLSNLCSLELILHSSVAC